jgi:Flp pilus assembly protein protease CpaA
MCMLAGFSFFSDSNFLFAGKLFFLTGVLYFFKIIEGGDATILTALALLVPDLNWLVFFVYSLFFFPFAVVLGVGVDRVRGRVAMCPVFFASFFLTLLF